MKPIHIFSLLLVFSAFAHGQRIKQPRTIIEAASQGNLEKVKEFVKQKVDLDSKDRSGQTALLAAIEADNEPIIAYLVEQGASVNEPGMYTHLPLVRAAYQNNLAIVDLLLNHGALINDQEKLRGLTALNVTGFTCDQAMVKELLKRGANPNILARNNNSVLHLMAKNPRCLEAARLIVEADPKLVALKDHSGKTPFDLAVESDDDEMVKLLYPYRKL